MNKIKTNPIGKKGGVIVRMGPNKIGSINKAKNGITEESSATLPLIQEGAEGMQSPPQLMSYREGEEDNFFNDDNNALNIQTNTFSSFKKGPNNKDLDGRPNQKAKSPQKQMG